MTWLKSINGKKLPIGKRKQEAKDAKAAYESALRQEFFNV